MWTHRLGSIDDEGHRAGDPQLIAAGGIAILLIEQDYDFAKSLADHHLVLSRGEVVGRGAGASMDSD